MKAKPINLLKQLEELNKLNRAMFESLPDSS